MSLNSQWDDLTFSTLNFPYNTIAAGLSEAPRLASGSKNTAITLGGTIIKRHGCKGIFGTDSLPFTSRIDRLWVYETMDTPQPNVYLVASVMVGTVWELYYTLLSSVAAWSLVPAYRGCNLSTQPHEAIVARGLFFIKSFPPSATDTLGTIILDGKGGTIVVKPWGALGSTTPAAIVGIKNNLAVAITTTTTAIVYTSTSTWPTAPFNFILNYETITATVNNTGSKTLTVLRGAQGTIPAPAAIGALMLNLPWSASAHPNTVNIGWNYSYAYKSITGNVTNRVAAETNPDNLPSYTGPFQNLIPQISIVGLADVTNFPSIIVFRTTDGGGTYFQLETIDNPGAGTFIYSDNSLVSASGRADPIPDASLNGITIAPTLTSNSPPPAVLAPLITGTDQIAPATPSAYYSGRIWYAIGNILFFSGNEEITSGVPEECFPSGLLGNFFRYQTPVLNVQATTNALYVLCPDGVHAITGSTLDTFNSSPVIQSVGAPYAHPKAITRYGENIIFLSNDYRIISASGSSYLPLSDELGIEIQTAINSGGEIDIKYWANLDKEYAVVLSVNKLDPSLSLAWVFDIKRSIGAAAGATHQNFWYSPWNLYATCMTSGRERNNVNQQSLMFANQTSSIPFLSAYDPSSTTTSDTTPGGLSYFRPDMIIVTNLFQTPSGNHINALRRPGVTTEVQYIQLDRTLFDTDTDPNLFWYADDLWTTEITLPIPTGPIFRVPSIGYKTLVYAVDVVCQRIALRIEYLDQLTNFELQQLTIIFEPTAVGG